MSSTAASLCWQIQDPLPISRSAFDAWDSWIRDPRYATDKVSEPERRQSEQEESSGSSSVADYEAAQSQVLRVEMLQELPEGRCLRYPIPLDLHRAPHYFWVTADGGFLHGVGDSPQAAIEDYGYALLDYYRMLQDEREALAPHLLEHLETLEELIVEE